MRTANVLKATRQIADEALYRSSLGGGGGGGGILPAASFLVNVVKGGNDVTGDGTDEKPFATVTKGLAFAGAIAGIGPTQPALVLVGDGTFPEDVLLPPYVTLASLDPSGTSTVIGTGGTAVALSPAWAAAVNAFAFLEGVTLNGNAVIDFSAVPSQGTFESNNTTYGNLTITGHATAGAFIVLGVGVTVFGTFTATGVSTLATTNVDFAGPVSILSSAGVPLAWTSAGDEIGSTLGINASAGQNITVTLTVSGVTGPLTLTDGGGGVTSFSATAGGIPSTVIRVGGAAAPVPLSPLVGLNSKLASGANAAATLVATSDGAGGVMWMAGGGSSPWTQVGGVGGTIEQVDPTASVKIGAATPTNTSFAAYGGTASGLHSIAIGNGAAANAAGDFALGISASATGTPGFPAVAIGFSAIASGEATVAIGTNSLATGDDAFAGPFGTANGDASFAIGSGTTAVTATSAAAFSLGNAQGQASIAGGSGTTGATGVYDFAWGRTSQANGSGAGGGASIGVVALSGGTSSDDATFSHGPQSVASLSGAAAFSGSTASGTGSFAADNSLASAADSFAGAEGVATGTGSSAFSGAEADGNFSFAAANGFVDAAATGAVALASGDASGTNSFAVGGTATFASSYKIGTDAGAFFYANSDGAGSIEIHAGASGILDIEGVTTGTTVGAAGGASPLPVTPTGYLHVTIAGTVQVIPFYTHP